MGRHPNNQTMRWEVGERIRQMREDRLMNMREAADMLGMSLNTYWRIESGAGSITLERLVSIAKKFEVSVDWLLGLSDTSTPLWSVN